VIVVTSSHGRCEEMPMHANGSNISKATVNPVPFHLIDDQANERTLRDGGTLADVAPTILGLLGLEKPQEMTGSDLRLL